MSPAVRVLQAAATPPTAPALPGPPPADLRDTEAVVSQLLADLGLTHRRLYVAGWRWGYLCGFFGGAFAAGLLAAAWLGLTP